MRINIKQYDSKIVEVDYTNQTTLGEMLDATAKKTGVARDQFVFCINGRRTYINDEPLQNFVEYLNHFGVDTMQEGVFVFQTLALGAGPFYRRGPQKTTHSINEVIDNSNDFQDLICPISMRAISGRQVKINTKFYDLFEFNDYLRQEHKKLHEALESNKKYELNSPLGEPLPPSLIIAMQEKKYTSAFSVLYELSEVSQAEYDKRYLDAIKDVSSKISVNAITSSTNSSSSNSAITTVQVTGTKLFDPSGKIVSHAPAAALPLPAAPAVQLPTTSTSICQKR